MSLSLWLALVGACLVISLTPGAGAINTMANSLGSGWARSIWGILGQQAALVLHVAIVAAGAGALVSRSHTAFEVIRYVGAAYLVFLGVRQFRAQSGHDDDAGAERVVEGAWPMFRRGLLVNLTNPKAIVFFLAFVPQFVRADRTLVPQYATLVATVVAVDVLVMWGVFAPAARGLARVIAREDGRRVVNRVFGGLFVGVGLLLATV